MPDRRGGPFIEGGDADRPTTACCPVNTHGGQLSAGRLHGYGFLHEACVQLWGEGGRPPGDQAARGRRGRRRGRQHMRMHAAHEGAMTCRSSSTWCSGSGPTGAPEARPGPGRARRAGARGGDPRAERREPPALGVRASSAIPQTRAAIGDVTAGLWEAGGTGAQPRAPAPQFFAAVDEWATGGLAAAPVHVVVCGDTTRRPEAQLASSIFPAVQNLLLAAARGRPRFADVDAAGREPAAFAPLLGLARPRRADGARAARLARPAARPGRARPGRGPPPPRALASLRHPDRRPRRRGPSRRRADTGERVGAAIVAAA